MANESKKTAAKGGSAGVRKPNPGKARTKKSSPAGKGTRSQRNKEKQSGVGKTGAKKLR